MQRLPTSQSAYHLDVESLPVDNGVAVIRLLGEADLHTAPMLPDALDKAIATKAALIVIDLAGVTFVDSMMLGVLLSATRRARSQDTAMRIVVDDPHVRRIFELTLLDRVLALYPTIELAVVRD